MRRVGGLVGLLLCLSTSAAHAETDGLPAGLALYRNAEGLALAASEGAPLYRLDLDRWAHRRDGLEERIKSRCADTCERLWIPVTPPKAFKPEGDWSVLQGWSGAQQLAYKSQPLYRFAGKSLDELTYSKVAPANWGSYSAPPTALVDGVPVTTRYWHAVPYQPPAPKLTAPASVTAEWSKTAYRLADSEKRELYTRRAEQTCTSGCEGFEPFPAPLAAQPIGAWRPMETQEGASAWSFRDKLVYRRTAGTPEDAASDWKFLEVR
jgi:predicted lipoprotein with Yx(FWY)xxD motif